MICEQCREAGNYNHQANRIGDPGRELLQRIARSIHLTCSDTNCPCHHVVGRVLRKDAA